MEQKMQPNFQKKIFECKNFCQFKSKTLPTCFGGARSSKWFQKKLFELQKHIRGVSTTFQKNIVNPVLGANLAFENQVGAKQEKNEILKFFFKNWPN